MNETPAPSKKEAAPLGIPPGSVRAILAILVVACAVACVLMQISVPEWFVGAAAGIVSNYFNGRASTEATRAGARSSIEVLTKAQ
jgi:hypothetical protein